MLHSIGSLLASIAASLMASVNQISRPVMQMRERANSNLEVTDFNLTLSRSFINSRPISNFSFFGLLSGFWPFYRWFLQSAALPLCNNFSLCFRSGTSDAISISGLCLKLKQENWSNTGALTISLIFCLFCFISI